MQVSGCHVTSYRHAENTSPQTSYDVLRTGRGLSLLRCLYCKDFCICISPGVLGLVRACVLNMLPLIQSLSLSLSRSFSHCCCLTCFLSLSLLGLIQVMDLSIVGGKMRKRLAAAALCNKGRVRIHTQE